jgi:SH3 domain protein
MRPFVAALALILAAMLLMPGSGLYAKGYYVKERVVIALKRSPNESAATVGSASSDDYLEVRDQSGGWVKVVTQKGLEGWVYMSYLTNESPRSLIIEQLNAKLVSQDDLVKTLQETNKTLEKENRELKYKLSNSSLEIQKSKNAFQKLKDDSKDYLNLEGSYRKLAESDVVKTRQLDELEKENRKLKLSERVEFTLIGGGFVVLGLILGFSLNYLRSKPRKTGYRL